MAPPLLLIEIQGTLNTLAGLVHEWNRWFCHPCVTFLQLQGGLVLAALGVGWLLAGLVRSKEVQRRRLQLPREDTGDEIWPGVTVILPLKGYRKHSLKNWESQLSQEYRGQVEVLFVVDSRQDPAFETASALAKDGRFSCGNRSVRVVVATPSHTNSQKIHNIQTGIKAASKASEWVLCVDDDVCLHPRSLQDSIRAMQQDGAAFMLTGYPFDIPLHDSSLLTYAALSYHLPLLIAFSLKHKTQFVWGGYMLFPRQAMLEDRHGIMQAWSCGGYSDDLIMAAKCGEHRLPILCPSFTIFPQRLEEDYSWAQYWNYLRRQVYVMDTWCSPLNRQINHTMMLLHSYLSLAFILPAITASFRLLLWILATILLPTQKVYGGPGTSLHWVGHFGADTCPWSSLSLLIFLLAFAFAAVCLAWMSGVILELFEKLSPREQALDTSTFHWGKLWLGFLLNNIFILPCMLYTKLSSRVVWSGVEYARRNGRIVRVSRPAGRAGQWRSPRQAIDAQVA